MENLVFIPVDSSLISAVAYKTKLYMPGDADNSVGDLHIKFKTGGTYRYSSVPITLLIKFLEAESQGKYFLQNIKPKYNCEKVEDSVCN